MGITNDTLDFCWLDYHSEPIHDNDEVVNGALYTCYQISFTTPLFSQNKCILILISPSTKVIVVRNIYYLEMGSLGIDKKFALKKIDYLLMGTYHSNIIQIFSALLGSNNYPEILSWFSAQRSKHFFYRNKKSDHSKLSRSAWVFFLINALIFQVKIIIL